MVTPYEQRFKAALPTKDLPGFLADVKILDVIMVGALWTDDVDEGSLRSLQNTRRPLDVIRDHQRLHYFRALMRLPR